MLSVSGFNASGGDTISVSGLGGDYAVTWASVPWNYSVGCGPVNSSSGNQIASIRLPNGQTYTFDYNTTYGLLDQINYPDGGYIRYVWGLTPTPAEAGNFEVIDPTSTTGYKLEFCQYAQPVITDRYVSFNGSTEVLHQHFQYSTTWPSSTSDWTAKSTIVTTTDEVTNQSSDTDYQYSIQLADVPPDSNGSFAAEIPVEHTVTRKDYSGNVLSTETEIWSSPRTRTSDELAWADGATKETTWIYNSWEEPDEADNYDYGASAPGPLLRKTLTTYASFAPHIVDRPSDIKVEDGSGNTVAETTFTYDQGAPGGTSGIEGKDYSSGNYGNLTAESKWVNTTGAWLTTTFTYGDLGNRLSETNPRGDTTTFSYADSWSGAGSPGPTDAYLTTITDPLGHTRKFSWNFASGELASATDENGNTTTYAYDDSLDRLTAASYPTSAGTAETEYTYNDTAPSPSITTSREISSGNWLTTVAVRDGMGHVVENETTSDPAGTDYVMTTYDGRGQVLTVTNPYRSASDPTYGITTYARDALGRVLTVTNPDNSTIATTYTGAATEVTDGGNGSESVSRISQVDGLGRLISVCEADSSAMTVGAGAQTVSCGQDIAGTGFLTTYGYGPLGNLIAVSQSGLNQRQFTYDSLSRLVSADNPESGLVKYTYDTAACGAPAAAGLLTCRTDARGITTAYAYDADSRLLTKTYSDGTPEVQLAYGNAPTVSDWGATLDNAEGRLISAETTTNGAMQTGEIFSYGPAGRVVGNQQCTPQNCGSSADTLNYGYDLLGDITSASNGANVTLSFGYNDAAQITTLSSSYQDAQHPATLLSNGTYNALGDLVSAALGNGQTETQAFNDRGRLTSRVFTGAPGTNPTPGTGSITLSGSERSAQIPATGSTGSITISGTEGKREQVICPAAAGGVTPQLGCRYIWHYNGGVVALTVNGITDSGYYGESSTDDTVASSLAQAVNDDPSMPVTASVSGATVSIYSKGKGTAVNYSLATSCTYASGPNYYNFTTCSFTGSLSGSTMTGGTDSTAYDTGTVSATINGQTESASYGQGSTPDSVASALATAITNSSSYATASASGATVAITAKGTGAGTNYSLSASSATTDPGQFSGASFSGSASGSSLTGGANGIGSGAYNLSGITYAPDGDVLSADDSVNGDWQYEYGPLNRLTEACTPNCSSPVDAAAYVYDRFGNRWQENAVAGTIPVAPQLTFDANNHITGASYDASGDLLSQGGNTFTFDAEGLISSADSGAVQYVYDAFGHRVEKTVGGASTFYLHDLAGRPITELTSAGGFTRGEIYVHGQHLATYADSTTYFDYPDWLGTTRMIATLAGLEQSACTSWPFGAGLDCTSSPTPVQFTGQVRDASTGLDHFPARYYAATWGRWMTPDWAASPTAVPYASFSNPESLDLYGYVLGNPATNADATGHWCLFGAIGTTCHQKSAKANGIGAAIATGSVGAGALDGAEAGSVFGMEFGPGDALTAAGGALIGTGIVLIGHALLQKANEPKGAPKPSPKFQEPTNLPQPPPREVPPGWRVRVGPRTEQYPDGYWRLYNPRGQPVDPSTMKPGTGPQTHVPLPPGWDGG